MYGSGNYGSASKEKSVSFSSSPRSPRRVGTDDFKSYQSPSSSSSRYTLNSPKYTSPLVHSYASPASTRISQLDSSSTLLSQPSSSSKYTMLQSDLDVASRSVNNVINAFRELQGKSRILVNERFLAIKERDELRDRVNSLHHDLSTTRSKSEIKSAEDNFSSRRNIDRIRISLGDLESKLTAEEDVNFAIQRGLSAQYSTIETYEHDVNDMRDKIQALRQRNSILTNDLNVLENRRDSLSYDLDELAMRHRVKCDHISESIGSMTEDIARLERSDNRSLLRLNAMTKYMELLLDMNGDLCETLTAREEAKARILKMADTFAPPRYAWTTQSKGTVGKGTAGLKGTADRYPAAQDVLELVEDAATASALEKRAVDAMKRSASRSKSSNYKSINKSKQHNNKSRQSARSEDYNESLSEGDNDGDVTIQHRRASRRAKSPSERLERRAAEVVAAVASTSASTSPLRYFSPTRQQQMGQQPLMSSSFIPSSGNTASKEFNLVAKERKESRDNMQQFAAFASKVRGQQLSDMY